MMEDFGRNLTNAIFLLVVIIFILGLSTGYIIGRWL